MAAVPLTLACAPYDRVVPLIDGRVSVEGCEISYFAIEAEEAFHRAYAGADFDVTELSASSHILTTARGQATYWALPIFLSRVFRHSAFYIRTDRGITKPEDLRGKIVGVPEYQMTAALWARGLLSDEYGLHARDIKWRNGGLNNPGRGERTPITLPADIELQPIGPGKTLSAMLEDGEIDAMMTARAPDCFTKGAANVDRLWPDYRAAEEAYYTKTGLFPIMHVVAIRKSLVAQHPWIAASVMKAFYQARKIALHEMKELGVLSVMLPWLPDDLARAQKVMGPEVWTYGVPDNRKDIDCMLRWSHEQGLSERVVPIEEVFAPGTLHRFQVKD